jgi:hypothetical protein
MKIAFVWYFNKASQVYDKWHDGLRAAIDLIGKKHTVDWYLDKDRPRDDTYDVILFWDDSNSEFFQHLPFYTKAKKGICLTTDPYNMNNLRNLDVVFVESDPIYKMVRSEGIRTIKAFGTDTDFFKPSKVKKDIEYLYPATFSPWKRQRDISHLGDKLTCIGTMQPDGLEDYDRCVETGVNIKLGYFPAEEIRDYYNRASKVIIPAVHGSERTVLESMSMNILPMVTNPANKRAMSYLKEYENSNCATPREFVIKNYSAFGYAADLLRGIE